MWESTYNKKEQEETLNRIKEYRKDILPEEDEIYLNRFRLVQEECFEQAMEEILAGKRKGKWLNYLFPMVEGSVGGLFGKYYSMPSKEAKRYMADPVLGEHMVKVCEALLKSDETRIQNILGFGSKKRVHGSMTLFSYMCPEYEIFSEMLDKYFHGKGHLGTRYQIKAMKR